MDGSGNLYRDTKGGGAYGWGTVFKLTPTGTETLLLSLGGPSGDGRNPGAGLVMDAAGNLYGTSRTLEWQHIPALAGLALATGDEELRQQIESLAISPADLMALSGLNDSPHILQLQSAITARLRKYQR